MREEVDLRGSKRPVSGEKASGCSNRCSESPAEVDEDSSIAEGDPRWQHAGDDLFRRIIANQEELNGLPKDEAESTEFKKLLTPDKKDGRKDEFKISLNSLTEAISITELEGSGREEATAPRNAE